MQTTWLCWKKCTGRQNLQLPSYTPKLLLCPLNLGHLELRFFQWWDLRRWRVQMKLKAVASQVSVNMGSQCCVWSPGAEQWRSWCGAMVVIPPALLTVAGKNVSLCFMWYWVQYERCFCKLTRERCKCKLARIHSHIPIRLCVIFKGVPALLAYLETLIADPDVVVLRVKNRLDPVHRPSSTAGFRSAPMLPIISIHLWRTHTLASTDFLFCPDTVCTKKLI